MKWALLFLLVSARLFPVDIHGEFQVGSSVEEPVAFTYIRLEVIQSPVTLYGSWRTWFELDLPSGYPFRDIYEAGLRIDWSNLFLDVNHFCNHPVWSQGDYSEWLNNKWGETITTISVGVRW